MYVPRGRSRGRARRRRGALSPSELVGVSDRAKQRSRSRPRKWPAGHTRLFLCASIQLLAVHRSGTIITVHGSWSSKSPWAGSSRRFSPAISRRYTVHFHSTASAASQVAVLPIPFLCSGHPISAEPDAPSTSTGGGGVARSVRNGAARVAPVGVRADHGRHHPRRRPRLLRHAPHRDLLQGEDGGEAAEVRGAHARQGEGGAAAPGRGAPRGPGAGLAGLVISSHPLAPARLPELLEVKSTPG